MAETGTIADTAQGIAAGEQTAEDVVRKRLDLIEASDPAIHSFVSYDRDRALSRARSIDVDRVDGKKLGPLAGVPLAIKDNICTTFGSTTCGSRMLETFCACYDAHVVERLESAGAVIVGKTNLDEFGMGSSTEHSAFGVTRNPWDTTKVAGGSSGGSAAAVAAGLVPGALGSDTGGSIRQPAAFCGVVGLKPTYGRVSRYGLVAFGSSLEQIGIITADVRDAALLLNVIAGRDDRDSTSADVPTEDYAAKLDRPLGGIRIGISKEHFDGARIQDPSPTLREYPKDGAPTHFGEGLDAEVHTAVQSAVDLMVSEGAKIVPIELPHMKYAVSCYYIIAMAEASSNLARFDGVRYGRRTANPKDVLDLYAASRGEGFGDEVKRRIMLGTYALSSGYYDAYYLKALKVRTLIKRDFDRAFEQVDVIASPVTPTTAFGIGEKAEDPLAMYLSDVFTVSANLAGTCAVSLPCGFDQKGLPIGFQLTGAPFAEAALLGVAHQYQLRSDYHRRRPPCVLGAGRGSARAKARGSDAM